MNKYSNDTKRMKSPWRLSNIAFFSTVVAVVLVICVIELQLLGQQDISVKSADFSAHKVADGSNLQYGIVIDCGSSGSRIFIYCWPPHNGDPKDLLNITLFKDKHGKPAVKKIEPGVSSYVDKPADVSNSMAPLLSYATEVIPIDQQKSTPVYVMATAGMRNLEQSQQDALLNDLKVDLPLMTNLQFASTQVELISGKQEGIYAWIAINYVLNKFDHSFGDDPLVVVQLPGPDKTTHVRKQTIGVLDMGGGSLQIAFELPAAVKFESPQEENAKNLIAEFNLGCSEEDLDHTYRVYVTTFLNYGGNSVRQRYEEDMIISLSALNNSSGVGATAANPFQDPCLPVGLIEELPASSGASYYVRGTGDFAQCKQRLLLYLNQTVPCLKEPCSLAGVFQPEIDIRHSSFYGFSEFYYSMEDILMMGGKYDFFAYYKAAKNYCATNWSTIQDWQQKNMFPRATLNRYRLQCFKSAWVIAVLHDGLHLPKHYDQLTTVQHIDNSEVHWSLGALLYKTRYYPLREIEKAKVRQKTKSMPASFSEYGRLYYVLGVFGLFFIVCGCFSFKQCQRQRRTRKASRLYTSLELDSNLDHMLNDLSSIHTIY